jgi:hypothetical protein
MSGRSRLFAKTDGLLGYAGGFAIVVTNSFMDTLPPS